MRIDGNRGERNGKREETKRREASLIQKWQVGDEGIPLAKLADRPEKRMKQRWRAEKLIDSRKENTRSGEKASNRRIS